MFRTSTVSILFICCITIAAGRSVVKRSVRTHKDQENFLRDFGYLEEDGEMARNVAVPHTSSDEAFGQAVRAFQQMAGIQVTGEVDEATIAMMNAPRCGVKDNVQPEGTEAYTLEGSKWDHTSLTYKFLDYTRDLPIWVQKSDIKKAFKVWEDVSSLKFRETNWRPDIDIRFRSVDGDSKYDFGRNTLAYAAFPRYGGDVVFDDDEHFTSGTAQGINLLQVAAHEFGHSLGLRHSNVPSALMAPYHTYEEDFKLDQDDVAAIQRLYPPN